MRNKTVYPCRDCYDRKPGCHADCERYIVHSETVKAEKEAIQVERNVIIMQDRYEKEKRGRLKRGAE